MKETKTPQQILDQAREEFEKDVCEVREYNGAKLWYWRNASLNDPNMLPTPLELFSWHTSTLQAFIEAEIARLEGIKRRDTVRLLDGQVVTPYIDEGYNQAVNDQITHLTQLLVTLKK